MESCAGGRVRHGGEGSMSSCRELRERSISERILGGGDAEGRRGRERNQSVKPMKSGAMYE